MEVEDTATQANIIYQMKMAGISFRGVDVKHKLPFGTANHAIRRPELRGEKAIITELRVKLGSENLDIHPYALWPRRFGDDGERLTESTIRRNYRKVEVKSLRKKERVA